MASGIYQLRNVLNNNSYIGSSKNVDKRIKEHFSSLEHDRHHSEHLQRAFNKYGKDNFIGELLITCHPDMLLWYEQQFIDQWKPEYNICKVAGRMEWTIELRKKLSNTLIKYYQSSDGVATMSRISASNMGREVTEITRKRISDSNMGRIISEDTRKKISIGCSGYRHTEDAIRRIAVTSKGRRHTDETRKKISHTKINHIVSDETRNKISYAAINRVVSDETRSRLSNVGMGHEVSPETRAKISNTKKLWWKLKKDKN